MACIRRFAPRLTPGLAPNFTGQVAWRALVPARGNPMPVARVDMAPGQHVVSYPIRGGALMNIVAVEERANWVNEGWSIAGDPAELRQRFQSFGPYVHGLLEQVSEVGTWGLFRHPVAEKWHDGRNVAIIGDAAHPTLPFMAQGANLAIEDAWALAACYDASAPLRWLDRFQEHRQDRAIRAVAAAQSNARNYHLRTAWFGRWRMQGLVPFRSPAPVC